LDERPIGDVVITDVTLREYGQNVPASSLQIFSPQIRVNLALKLIEAGFRRLEVISCVHPRISPAMDEETIRTIAGGVGRTDPVTLITLVPNWEGYKTFLSAGLGPDGYHHTLGIFFSAVETHNRLNLGRTIKDTLKDYRMIARDALQRNIPVAAYISAAFGYRPGFSKDVVRPGTKELGDYLQGLLDMGAATVTLSDLQGVADERETQRVFEGLLKNRDREVVGKLGYHPHHVRAERAMANSKVAYEIGIRRFDSSVGGTGGCITGAPGNQPTEALVALFEKMGVRTGIDLQKVLQISRFMEKELYSKINIEKAE
jgi:hydroxymethylglutaryl-CoA lyase